MHDGARDGDGRGYDAEEDEELDKNSQLHWESLHDCWRIHREQLLQPIQNSTKVIFRDSPSLKETRKQNQMMLPGSF